jgi:hypothetical protein
MTEITQEIINKYAANTDEFWKAFHTMLRAPYSYWRNHSDEPLQGWVDMCWNSTHILRAVKNIGEFPVLKGEGVVCALDSGMLLTNYRFIYAEGQSLINIPLHNLLHYDIMSSATDTRNDLVIKYLRKGNEETLRIDEWIKDEIVRAVRNAAEYSEFNDEQKALIETSTYDLERKGLSVPKVVMLPKSQASGCFDPNGCFGGFMKDFLKNLQK